ncbi:MAG: hypothetical protein AAB388_04880 [Patescibacteria group bacterium]
MEERKELQEITKINESSESFYFLVDEPELYSRNDPKDEDLDEVKKNIKKVLWL